MNDKYFVMISYKTLNFVTKSLEMNQITKMIDYGSDVVP